jgi:glycerol-3-phosphate dehydrogenase
VIRDLRRLASGEFDLLVIGGGIYGLATAYDAAQRGLSVALVERADFGGATSFSHLKTIHGGLRYLQTGDLRRMRESIRERRAFARIAPRFVAPLAFVMPASGSLTRHPLAMKVAFAIDAFIGSDRNEGLPASHHLPAGKIISSDDCRARFGQDCRPSAADARHAAVWHDYETVHGERLTLAFALAADAHGGGLANYVEATGALKSGSTLIGVRARDVLTEDTFDIRARSVAVAAGPWTSTLLSLTGVRRTWPLIKAMNLVTTRPARTAAMVVPTRSGRALVMLPWQGRTLVGTSESVVEQKPDDQQALRSDVSTFLAEINETFSGFGLDASEVSLVHRGIVPAVKDHRGFKLMGHSSVLDHASDGIPNLVSIVGVKYTTARVVAERAVDLVLKKLGRSPVACRTAETVLPTAGLQDAPPENPIRDAVETEMAQTLVDAVVRRTGRGAAGYPGDGLAFEYASAMQALKGWSIERLASEITALKRFYELT